MRIKETIVAAGCLAIVSAGVFSPSEALAQSGPPTVPPIAVRDTNWGTVSHITMAVGIATVTLMPRIYYNDPEATVGWKGRWHFSLLAPAMTLTTIALLTEGPIKNALKSPRPNCSLDNTLYAYPGSNCETFGGPSTHAFAAWGATGTGLGIFLVDTLKYSNAKFSAGAFVGNVAVPLVLSVLTSMARGIPTSTAVAYEDPGQVIAGTLTGFGTGLVLGLGYALFQRPNCGYGNSIFCW